MLENLKIREEEGLKPSSSEQKIILKIKKKVRAQA